MHALGRLTLRTNHGTSASAARVGPLAASTPTGPHRGRLRAQRRPPAEIVTRRYRDRRRDSAPRVACLPPAAIFATTAELGELPPARNRVNRRRNRPVAHHVRSSSLVMVASCQVIGELVAGLTCLIWARSCRTLTQTTDVCGGVRRALAVCRFVASRRHTVDPDRFAKDHEWGVSVVSAAAGCCNLQAGPPRRLSRLPARGGLEPLGIGRRSQA